MASARRQRLPALGAAVLVSVLLLVAGRQITLDGWYSAAPAHRAQVDALLDGRLALSDAPEALFHDFAWAEGGVQQVWGLGVPLWQAPFEAAGRIVGLTPFPDRLPLLVWLALMVYVLVRAFGFTGAALITALLPAIVTVVRGRVGVYEETALYAYGAAMILLGGMLRVGASPSRWRFVLLLGCAGLVGFIRPTAWVYGLATAVIASAMWLQHRGRRGLVEIVIGGVLFLGGGLALYGTNAARFGNGFEFGHRTNLQSLPGNLYATRFSYPMQRASLPEATLELAASLFDRPEKRARGSFFQRNLHHGVSKKPRWREYYFTTYSWLYLPLLVGGVVLGVLAWRRRAGPSVDPQARWLFAWALIALVPLLAFYVRAPFVSSRYQLDLAPAFAALLVIAWRGIEQRVAARRHGELIATGALAVAWLLAIVTARTAQPRSADPVDRETAARSMATITEATKHPRTLPNAYDLADPWVATHTDLVPSFDRCSGDTCLHGVRTVDSEQWTVSEYKAGRFVALHRPPPAIYLNLYRWDLETGQMPVATYAFVDAPQFIELEVSTVEGAPPADWAREVRVNVGRTHLRLTGTRPSARGTTLRFEASGLPDGLQVAFFAFGPDAELAKPKSRYAVHRIQWR